MRTSFVRQLPEGWQEPQVVQDTIEVDGLEVHRAGVSAVARSGEEICGSAADRHEPPAERAWFELFERSSVIEALATEQRAYPVYDDERAVQGEIASTDLFPTSVAPAHWIYSRSNGVALHRSWAQACHGAFAELAERDRVLRAWRGEMRPRPVSFESPTRAYDWMACALPPARESFAARLEVAVVAGFPRSSDLPLAVGFGAGATWERALGGATREALQQLAFLWGEPVASTLQGEPSAFLHLDAYQVPERRSILRSWLERGHPSPAAPAPQSPGVSYVDLTPGWLPNGLRVAKAICKGAIPLIFGDPTSGPSPVRCPAPFDVSHLRPEARLHPIP